MYTITQIEAVLPEGWRVPNRVKDGVPAIAYGLVVVAISDSIGFTGTTKSLLVDVRTDPKTGELGYLGFVVLKGDLTSTRDTGEVATKFATPEAAITYQQLTNEVA